MRHAVGLHFAGLGAVEASHGTVEGRLVARIIVRIPLRKILGAVGRAHVEHSDDFLLLHVDVGVGPTKSRAVVKQRASVVSVC